MNDRGKLLALDVGLARIGVATCDPLWLSVRPLTVIRRTSRRNDFAEIARLITDEEIVAIICGLPLNMDGSEGSQAATVREWALRLAQALRALLSRSLPIIFWDERLTTFEAQNFQATGAKAAEDALAAAVILQSYLDAMRRGEPAQWGQILLPAKDQQSQS
jgi:putative Holliday junction resolvase